MPHVVGDEIDDRLQRVVVRNDVEIERAAQKMLCAVGKVELQRRCHTFPVEEINESVNISLLINYNAVADAGCLAYVLGYHNISVFKIL